MIVKELIKIALIIGMVLGALFLAGFIQHNLFVIQSVYGQSAYGLAGSLDNLKSEVSAEIVYRNELIGYLFLHNVTINPNPQMTITLNATETPDLENIAKSLMLSCKLNMRLSYGDC